MAITSRSARVAAAVTRSEIATGSSQCGQSPPTDPAAGPHASDAPLFAEVAGLAFTALIDGVVPAGPGRRHRGWFGLGGGVPAAPRCSTTGVAAVALPADPCKRRPADRQLQ